MIEQDLYNTLSGAASVMEICANRIYPVELPDECAMPAIEYKILSGPTQPTFSTGGISKLRVQIDCWGSTYADAVNLRAAVIATLHMSRTATFTGTLAARNDLFNHELLQYCARADFYILTSE
jgi:hypothetical protein